LVLPTPASANQHGLGIHCYADDGQTKIVDKHGLNSHGYADDLQIFGHAETEQAGTLILRFSNCVDELKSWMASSRLRLNPMKTERDLGVYLDSDLSLRSHIANITKICFFHIRQLRLARRSLTLETVEALMRSFIHSRLDYCNGILAGQPGRALEHRNTWPDIASR
jgi:hypothetical protein